MRACAQTGSVRRGTTRRCPLRRRRCWWEVPYLLAQAILFSAISYPMVHFEANPGEPHLLRLCALLLLIADSAPATTHQS